MKSRDKTPPRNAQRIYRAAELPRNRAPARFLIKNPDGKAVSAILHKRQRQILELLMRGPVYCASPVRISDIVYVLKREQSLDVHTEFYPGDKDNGSGDYGVYFLRSQVLRIDELEVAA